MRRRATLQDALRLLKAERVRQGLSLADIQDRTGIEPQPFPPRERRTVKPHGGYVNALCRSVGKATRDRAGRSVGWTGLGLDDCELHGRQRAYEIPHVVRHAAVVSLRLLEVHIGHQIALQSGLCLGDIAAQDE